MDMERRVGRMKGNAWMDLGLRLTRRGSCRNMMAIDFAFAKY